MTFSIPEVNKSGNYSFSVGLRMMPDFPFKNICIVMQQKYQEPDYLHRDTLRFEMTDENGNLGGDGLASLSFEKEFVQTKLHKGQHGTVSLYHIMAKETLPNIKDVGLKMSSVE